MRARTFFEAAKDAARLLEALGETEARVRAAAELQAQQYTEGRASATDADPPALRLLALADETADEAQAARLMLDAAMVALYGEDGRGGLAAEAGSAYADAVSLVYLQLVDERDAAEMIGIKPHWVPRLCTLAFDKLDRMAVLSIPELH